MKGRLVRALFLALVRLFYPTIVVEGRARIPTTGPVIVVANHPNGLLDPLLLCVALRRPVSFLAKSTFFANPVGRLMMAAFGAIAVYRAKDGQDTRKNEETFGRARAHLDSGGFLALFPEGISHSEPRIQPLKTGAARIALGAEHARGFTLNLRILPVGLVYEDKGVFRSRVAMSVGEPLPLQPFETAYVADEHGAVKTLTARIHDRLATVVLEADTQELWRGFLVVAAWTHSPPTTDLAIIVPRAKGMARAYRRLSAHAPERAMRIVDAARHFARMLRAAGVDDPFALESEEVSMGAVAFAALPMIALLPIALIGIVLGWAPYRVVKPMAVALSRGEADVVGTIKLVLGLVVMSAAYGAEALAAGAVLGWRVGLLMLIGGPITGFVALDLGERVQLRANAMGGLWKRATRARLVAAITAQRRTLAETIDGELAPLPDDEDGDHDPATARAAP